MDAQEATAMAARDQAWADLAQYKPIIEKISDQGLNWNSPFEVTVLKKVLHVVRGELVGRSIGDIT